MFYCCAEYDKLYNLKKDSRCQLKLHVVNSSVWLQSTPNEERKAKRADINKQTPVGCEE